jgi:peptidoglycan lytic transglycosylase D
VLLLDPGKVRVVTLGSEEFLELETARRGKRRLTVTARSGDTLAKVGRRYGLTPGDLARINRFSYNTELHEGQRIVVYSPTGAPAREVAMGLTPERRSKTGTGVAPGIGAVAAGRPPSALRGAKAPVRGASTKVAVKTTDKPTGKPGVPTARPAPLAPKPVTSTPKSSPRAVAAKLPPPAKKK